MKVYVARSGAYKITKKMVHGHEMTIMVIKHEAMDMEQSVQGKSIIIGFAFAGLR
jgi:hypothetical protein